MKNEERTKLLAFLGSCLSAHGDTKPILDHESLFLSGRLDSLTMTQLVVFLEQQFNVNFAEVSFEVEMIDSVNEIEDFLKQFVS